MADINSVITRNDDFTFKEAVKYFGEKIPVSPAQFKKLSEKYRNAAFTVSGYTKIEILMQFQDELLSAIENGETMESFRQSMNGFLEAKGYEGLTLFQADNIFRTNVQTAYNAGHYEKMTEPAVIRLRPYWQYRAVGDKATRPEHAAMDGKVFPADDPVWDTWYPPNGYKCRCTVTSLSERQVRERGIEVLTEVPQTVLLNDGSVVNIRPDVGFSTNPAKTRFEPDLAGYPKPLVKAYEAMYGERKEMKADNIFVCSQTDVSDAPDKVKLLPLGHVESEKGDFEVDEESFRLMRERFIERGNDIVIDYEHQTLKDVQAPAGGWIKDLLLEDGAIAAKVEWTEQARKYLKNREYRYLSPVVFARKSDNKAYILHSAALTNAPAINGMFPIVNSFGLNNSIERSNTTMDVKKLAALLELGEDATEEQILESIKAAVTDAKKLKEEGDTKKEDGAEDKIVANKVICGLLGVKQGASTEDAAAAIMALKNGDAGNDFLALKQRIDERDADDAVMKALKGGKVTPALKDWARAYALKDPSGFAAFIEKAPQAVPMGELEIEPDVNKSKSLDEATLLVCKQLGVSKEDIEKYGRDVI